MQTQTTTARTAPILSAVTPPVAARYPARDFGTGYGRSSGYATQRRYSQSTIPSRFRFV